MPEISRFFGIRISMYHRDHPPPHFHAKYGEHSAVVDIHSLTLTGGTLPPRALGLVVEWASQHQVELMELWALAANQRPLHKIDPLQ